MKHIQSLVYATIAALVFVGCSVVKYVPVETIKEVKVVEKEYVRDTVVRIELEKARISDFVDVGDTLVLSTDLARSVAFIDTTRAILRGSIENIKKSVEKPVQIKEKIVYRDTVITKEVPVEVEVEKIVKVVPWPWRVMSVIGLIALFYLAIKVAFKFSKQ